MFARRAIWSLVVLLIASLILTPAPTFAQETPFTVALATDTVTLDPALATDGPSAIVATQLFDTLLDFDGTNLLPSPGLAENWTASADGRVWTFFLRPGVQFHDGTPVDAEAVVFNIQRWWDPANPYHQGSFDYFGWLFFGFKGDASCLLTDVRAEGSTTVVITLAQAYSPILSTLASPWFSIASPKAIRAGTLAAAPVGSGPFRFVDATTGVRVRLAANPGYWNGAPASQNLSFLLMQDQSARISAVESGQVHAAYGVYADPGNPDLRTLSSETAVSVGYLGINQDHDPFASSLVRQAIAHAVDKDHVMAAAYGDAAQAADQFLPAGMFGRDQSLVDYAYNPSLAQSLLAQAGFPSGITTTLAYRNVPRLYMPKPPLVAQTLKADMEAAGIHLQVTEYESGVFIDKVYGGELDLFLLGWGSDLPNPYNFFGPHFCRAAGLGPVDDELCEKMDIARATASVAEQTTLYEWASRRVHDNAPLVPLANSRLGLVLRYDVVGVSASPLGLESWKDARMGGSDMGTVAPTGGANLSFVDAAGQTTQADIPPGAVDEETTLHLSEVAVDSAPDEQALAGFAFSLEASRGGERLENFTFAEPITLTVAYSDSNVSALWEDSLAIYYRDGDAWVDAATTCTPNSDYVRDLDANIVSVRVCHLSLFGLFGDRWPAIYVPTAARE